LAVHAVVKAAASRRTPNWVKSLAAGSGHIQKKKPGRAQRLDAIIYAQNYSTSRKTCQDNNNSSADLLPSRQAMKKERCIQRRTRDGAEVIAQKACDAKPFLTSRTPFGMT